MGRTIAGGQYSSQSITVGWRISIADRLLLAASDNDQVMI